MRRLSIIIPNYNYGDYVGAAIDSALAVDWPDVEVIVVDDGSTDGSRQVIESYGDAITAIFQDNSGPRIACNAGFDRSSGEAVVFLDSDDMLEPTVAREVASVWRPGVSKVQFPMTRIDREGVAVGGTFPHFAEAPTPELLRLWMRRTGAYPTPPGSGNVYARTFLERLFPLGGQCGDSTDSACLAAAPFLGDVVTLTAPLARYRQHGGNRSHVLGDHDRFTKQVLRAYQRHLFAQEVSGTESDGLAPLFRGRHLLQLRVAHRRLRPKARPIPTDSAVRMLRNALVSPLHPGPESVVHRVVVAGWSIATLIAPPPLARRLIEARFRQGGVPGVRRVTSRGAA